MRNRSILVVEDDAVIALHTYEMLTKAGYAVPGMFAAGEDLLDYLDRSGPPDLILMDIGLGGGGADGIETARRVREYRDVPVIFLSSYEDETRRARAQEISSSRFVVKPVFDHRLMEMIGDVIGKPGPG